MNLDELTLGQIKELSTMTGSKSTSNPYQKYVGKAVFIRTITMYYLGRLKTVYENELVLEECSWIADTGRFHDALRDGTAKEVEPYPCEEVIIGRGAILDVCEWNKELLREQK